MHRFFYLFLVIPFVSGCIKSDATTDFVLVAYNVENLFDIDGVAIYNDYKQDEADDPYTYTRRKLLTKLINARRTLAHFNSGIGPEIVLFQEFEADFTPQSTTMSSEEFLLKYSGLSVESMLTDGWQTHFADISSVHWLLKALDDIGISGYHVVSCPAKPIEDNMAHTNAIFSKFPIRWSKSHRLHRARDIIEAELDINGHGLVVYCNHWKSGASNPNMENIRVQNAQVLHRLVQAQLSNNPQADIIIGGDLNSHYNHSSIFADIKTGINDVLGADGDETFQSSQWYNFWYELPSELRYSEVWRGRRGSLMHLISSRGLYDNQGISYIDGSFNHLILPEINADIIGRPLEWNFAGTQGGGTSDHFPVFAHFSTRAFASTSEFSLGEHTPSVEIPHSVVGHPAVGSLKEGAFLSRLSEDDYGDYVGRLYRVEATIVQMNPLMIRVGGVLWSAHAVERELMGPSGLQSYLENNDGEVELVIRLNIYRGRKQLLIDAIL